MENDRAFYDRFAQAMARAKSGRGTQDDLMFLQDAMTRIPPSSDMWKNANEATKELIQQWSPSSDTTAAGVPVPEVSDFGLAHMKESGFDMPFPDPPHEGIPPSQADQGNGKDPEPASFTALATDDSPGWLEHAFRPDQYGVGANDPAALGIVNEQDDDTLMASMPEGYSFSNAPAYMAGILRENPEVLMNLMQKQNGGGAASEAWLMPFLQSADVMAGMGLLGGGQRDDLFGGPVTNTGALTRMEDYMDQISQPGMQFIDPTWAYEEAFRRASNTDFSQLSGQNGQPVGPEDIISMTNSALMASAPWMTQEAQASLSGMLQRAGVQYISAIASGEIDASVSYPAYLSSIGADRWLSGE